MERTGTWNSDIVINLVLLMLLPVFISFLVKIIGFFYQPVSEETVSLSIEPGLDDIKRAAIERAAAGDRYARDWCMKHVYAFDSEPIKQSNQAAKPVEPSIVFLTDKQIMRDTIQALIAVGFKKNEAQRIVTHLGTTKKYKEVGEMFLEIIQNKKK
jgi:hypothetical protein